MSDASVGADPELLGDDGGRARMVAGDHDRPNPGAFRACDGVLRFETRRIDHADQSGEHQALFHPLVRAGGVVRQDVLLAASGQRRQASAAPRRPKLR